MQILITRADGLVSVLNTGSYKQQVYSDLGFRVDAAADVAIMEDDDVQDDDNEQRREDARHEKCHERPVLVLVGRDGDLVRRERRVRVLRALTNNLKVVRPTTSQHGKNRQRSM